MKKLSIIAVCVAVVSLLLGSVGFSFSKSKVAMEGVQDTSDTLLFDVSSISVFAFVCSDFFSGADSFHMALVAHEDGSAEIIYQSFEKVLQNGLTEYKPLRGEVFLIFQEGTFPDEEEQNRAWKRIYTPVKPFIEWQKAEYNGAFAEIANALQYVSYVLGMIWGVVALIVLILIDTVGVAWELISVVNTFVGLA